MAARLSCIEAEDSSAAIGAPLSAVSRCSLQHQTKGCHQ